MAAAKLCCNARLRSESPSDEPSRPIRHFRSLANIKSHLPGNKTSPPSTIASTNANRPCYPADDLEIRRIFVAASLPEDHPDAFRIRGRKPDVDESIIRSPSFTRKLRKQLSRKSLATGKSSTDNIKYPLTRPLKLPNKNHRPKLSDDYDQDAQSIDLSQSRLASLKLETCTSTMKGVSEEWYGHSTQAKDLFGLAQESAEEPRRSISVPLASCPPSPAHQLRRSRSFSNILPDLGQGLDVHVPSCTLLEPSDMWPLCPPDAVSEKLEGAPDTLHVRKSPEKLQQAPRTLSGSSLAPEQPHAAHTQVQTYTSTPQKRPGMAQNDSTQSLHLHSMHISQHLRSTSQKSDETSSSHAEPAQWAMRASLNSIMVSSFNSKHGRDISSPGLGGFNAPSAWGRMIEDETSSIYSRRPSTSHENQPLFTSRGPFESSLPIPKVTRAGIIPDLPPATKDVGYGAIKECRSTEIVPNILNDLIRHPQDLLVPDAVDTERFGQWSDRGASDSLPKSDSSGSLGKLSKFKEDILLETPTSKTPWKRRSVLRIFIPKLSKSKLRSASTPLLTEKKQPNLTMYDGPFDAPELLSVPTPPFRPNSAQRGMGSSNFGEAHRMDVASTSSLTAPSPVPSRKSLMEYERNLSIAGDSRRRKSTINEPIDQVAQSDYQLDPPERGLRRASPLAKVSRKGTEEALMEKALQQHQLEKAALVRTSKKKIQAIVPTTPAPVFKSPFDVSLPETPKGPLAGMDDLDPLDAAGPSASSAARRSQSMHDLQYVHSFPHKLTTSGGKKPSTVWTMGSVAETEALDKPRPMPLSSWSRFPSHSRARRCRTASQLDSIISRDFAYPFKPDHYDQAEYRGSSDSTSGRSLPIGVKRKNWVTRSGSMTFGAVFRYYSSLFTSSAARNRRSSIATGGKLEHPELEVLPPVLPTHNDTTHHTYVMDQLDHFIDHIREEGHHLKEEGQKVLGHQDIHKNSSQPRVVQAKIDNDERPKSTPPDLTTHSQVTSKRDVSKSSTCNEVTGMDGTAENETLNTEPASEAHRLSRMYQTFVELPTSLDDIEAEHSTRSEGYEELPDASSLSSTYPKDTDVPDRITFKTPAAKFRMSMGPIVRRFPSATIVDDGKGHFRSISLISVDSGKSVRKSTRDLLEFVKATEVQELAKLMATPDDTTCEDVTS